MMFELILGLIAFAFLVGLAFLNDGKDDHRYEEDRPQDAEELQALLGVVTPQDNDNDNDKRK
jgi:hypothetical protein